jgi:hypothetical protein
LVPATNCGGDERKYLGLLELVRELLELMQSGKLEPEVAFLNASLVHTIVAIVPFCILHQQ